MLFTFHFPLVEFMSKRAILLEALASTPKDLDYLLRRAEETAVHRRPIAQEWSIADVLIHLATVETSYIVRLQRIVTEERPYLPYIHPDNQPGLSSTPLADLLRSFETARQNTLAYLQGLPPGTWQRPALHETLGETKLRFMVQLLVDHDTEHLNQITQIQQQNRTS